MQSPGHDYASPLDALASQVQEDLAAQMQTASDAMEFERAAALRDRIRALTQVQGAQGINPRNVSEADVIARLRLPVLATLSTEEFQSCT